MRADRLDMIQKLVFVDITESGIDPVLVVCSQNLFCRYLSVSQRTSIAVELSRWVEHSGDRKSEDFKRSYDHLTTQVMATKAGENRHWSVIFITLFVGWRDKIPHS